MLKYRLTIIAIILCASALAGHAQPDEITVDTKPTPKDIQTWLDSGDPRLIAWGAYFARESAGAGAISAMVRLVEGWTPPDGAQNTLGRFRIDAMSEVLDALVQRNEQVPPAGLKAIATSFPRQAVILASRLPLPEATPLLLTWYENGKNEEHLAIPRIAAMMLAKAPPPGFAASVLAESEEDLEVMVESDSGVGHGGGVGSGMCVDGWGLPSPNGWPPFFDYRIEENNRSDDDSAIVAAGGDRITYRRFATNRNWGSCAYPLPLNAETRHRLLAEMLGVTEEKMPWKVQESETIIWKGQEQVSLEFQAMATSEEEKLHEAAKALYAKRFLTKKEFDSVRPRLSITVFDYRKPVDIPLPHLISSDPRTTITYGRP
jgi:hypothetical protein